MTHKLIKDGKVQPNNWLLLGNELTTESLGNFENQDVIIPLRVFLSESAALHKRSGKTGVWLDSHEQPGVLSEKVHSIPVIALNFPEFKDGRPFSSARELRQRMLYTGEIRAIGDVLRDQLFYMHRCGFNAFLLRDDQDTDAALAAFNDFRDAYQPAIDQPLPLFRRRNS